MIEKKNEITTNAIKKIQLQNIFDSFFVKLFEFCPRKYLEI